MRMALALPLLLLGACEANVDRGNEAVTLDYDQNLAENAIEDIGNEAEDIAGHVANDVSETADKVGNEVGDVDVDVDTGGNETAPANAN